MGLQLLTGLPSSYRAPVQAIEISFGQGPSTASAGAWSTIYAMPLLSTGTWTAATVYECKREQDARLGGGTGSPVHRAVRGHFSSNREGKVFALPIAETSGGSPVAATATVTFATTATATGSARVWVAGDLMSIRIKSGDTVTTTAGQLVAAIKSADWLPVTASNSSGVVTITAKLKGTSQGDGTIGVIRLRVEIDSGLGTTIASSGAFLGSAVAGAEGTTTEAATLATALLAIDASRFYYVATSTNTSTALGNLATHITAKVGPLVGMRCQGFSAFTGAQATAQTLAIARNYERVTLFAQTNSNHDVAELVALHVAVLQKRQATNPAYNFDNYRESDYRVQATYANTDFPDGDDVNDAVTDGVALVISDLLGARLSMLVNTRSKDSSGSNDDFRATEGHRVAVMDWLADTWALRDSQELRGLRLTDDPRNADGTINLNGKIPPLTMTPKKYKTARAQLLEEAGERQLGYLQRVDDWKTALQVNIDPNNGGRLEAGVGGRVVDLLHQVTVRMAENNPG